MFSINSKFTLRAVLLLIMTAAAGCAAKTPTISTGPDAEVTYDGLYKIENSAADEAWAMPNVDLSGYSKIMLQGVGIEYRPGGESGKLFSSRSSGGPYEVTEEQKARFQSAVKEVFTEEIARSKKFVLVDEPGPDVLLVRGGLFDVVSYVPPEAVGRVDVYLSDVGAATLVLEIRDSVTDAILIRAVDRRAADTRDGGGMMMPSNRVSNTAEVKRLIRRWASKLRDRLDTFSGYSNVE